MVNYASIQHKIDRGLGKAGQKLGQPFLSYRVGATSTGDFPTAWTSLASVNLFRQRCSDRNLESALKSGLTLFWSILGDIEPYQLGDVFILNDPAYSPGVSYGAGASSVAFSTDQFIGMGLAAHLPVALPVAGRLDRRAGIYRPATAPATQADGSLYWKQTKDNDLPLQLSGGSFSFGAAGGMASLIPCGFASNERPSGQDIFPDKVPGMSKVTRYFVYVPPLNGYLPKEGDAIITENGQRYRVVNPYYQMVGFVGYQLSVERQISQAGT